jgi:putative ABC transport system permease protein
VSEPFSRRFGVARGDKISLRTPSGPRSLEIEAIFYDYSSDRGVIVMDRSLFGELFQDRSADTLAVYLGPGEDSELVGDRIRSALSGQALSIQPSSALRASALRVFDRTFLITYGLEVIALIVAALGVTNTLATLILERQGEFSLLRFLGAFPKQIRRITLAEATVLGLTGCLLGLALGLVLSLLLIYVINLQSFGWTIQFDFPFLFVSAGLVLIFLVTVVAGIYPALLATRMDALRALRTG